MSAQNILQSIWKRTILQISQKDVLDYYTNTIEPSIGRKKYNSYKRVISLLDMAKAHSSGYDLVALSLAILFKDIGCIGEHFEIGGKMSSSETSNEFLYDISANPILIEDVDNLILSTVFMEPLYCTDNMLLRLMIDIELSDFTEESMSYKKIIALHRKECAYLSDEEYADMRGDYLTQLLSRDLIYTTGAFLKNEQLARENIQNELDFLFE